MCTDIDTCVCTSRWGGGPETLSEKCFLLSSAPGTQRAPPCTTVLSLQREVDGGQQGKVTAGRKRAQSRGPALHLSQRHQRLRCLGSLLGEQSGGCWGEGTWGEAPQMAGERGAAALHSLGQNQATSRSENSNQGPEKQASREPRERHSRDRTGLATFSAEHPERLEVRRAQVLEGLRSPSEASRSCRVNKVAEAQRGRGPCPRSHRH